MHLTELFPDYSSEALWATLEANSYNLTAAAEELCQLESELTAQWRPSLAQQQTPAAQVCIQQKEPPKYQHLNHAQEQRPKCCAFIGWHATDATTASCACS